jgi:3-oxoacyl-[acyl-carrier protein] reductase
MSGLKGKKAIVTGAGHARGIGCAVARKLAAEGADVAVVDLLSMKGGLEETAEAVRSLGSRSLVLTADVASSQEVVGAVQAALGEFGNVDILVNNAGIGIGSAKFLELSDDEWTLTLEVNLLGAMRFARAILPSMCESGGGAIINVASLCGLRHIPPTPPPYTASKFALVGLTKAIAMEFGAKGVRCNAICPGSVDTQMRKTVMELIGAGSGATFEEADAEERASIALGRPAEPEEIADAVSFLAGPGGSYITGVALPVDGGMGVGL